MGVCLHLNLGLKATFKFKGKVILENCDPLDQLPDHSFLVRIHLSLRNAFDMESIPRLQEMWKKDIL